jgi:hypothetical protein
MLFSLLFSKSNLIPNLDRMLGPHYSRQNFSATILCPLGVAEQWVTVYLKPGVAGKSDSGPLGVPKDWRLIRLTSSPNVIRVEMKMTYTEMLISTIELIYLPISKQAHSHTGEMQKYTVVAGRCKP